jgi:hypothetical protein
LWDGLRDRKSRRFFNVRHASFDYLLWQTVHNHRGGVTQPANLYAAHLFSVEYLWPLICILQGQSRMKRPEREEKETGQ